MKSLLKILVIEDRENHKNDFDEMFAAEIPKGNFPVQIEILHAADLATATHLIHEVDAIISDVFFPDVTGGEERENGTEVAKLSLTMGKPILFVTSTYHHGSRTEPVNQWCVSHGVEMFDCYPKKQYDETEAEHKNWKGSLFGILALLIGVEFGHNFVETSGIFHKFCVNDEEKYLAHYHLKCVFEELKELIETDAKYGDRGGYTIRHMKELGFKAN